MKNIRNAAGKIEQSLTARGITKYSYYIAQKETRELTAENGEFSLFRTLFDNSATVSAFKAGKNGIVHGNDFSDRGLDELAGSAVLSAESAVRDSAHDISPEQEAAKFRQGCLKPDFDRFFERINELVSDIKAGYPKIQILSVIGEYVRNNTLFRNSNGVDFERNYGLYGVMVEFSAHDGDKTTSLDYVMVNTKSLDGKFIDMGGFRYRLDSAQKQLEQISIEGKFEGPVVFTPECFTEFLSFVQSCFISDGVLIDGTSIWKNKLGKRVASSRLSVALNSYDPRIVAGERYTADGFRTEELPIIENGILKNFTIGLYAAKKTKRRVSKNSSSDVVVKAGDESLESIITGIDKGIIIGRFSGGTPGTNGDFSGVAKNSFYIEGGRIKGAVSELMINGNLAKMLMDIRSISSETVADGTTVIPYVCVDGLVVSGK
ncbi:MAG: TldD/PmbA family protein [Sphaerochaeta sp.]